MLLLLGGVGFWVGDVANGLTEVYIRVSGQVFALELLDVLLSEFYLFGKFG